MSHYEYFLIFLSFAFCGYASYTDLKKQEIHNFCSLGLVYAGTLSQLVAWYLGKTTPLSILGLFLGGGLIAFALYWFGVFSPGDSKLLWGLCLILPSSLFRNLGGALSFPPLILVLNIIVPYSAGLIVYLFFRFVLLRNKSDFLRSLFRVNFQKSVLLEKAFNLLLFIGIGSALTYLLQTFGWELDRFLSFLFVLVVFMLMQKLLSAVPKTSVSYTIIGFVCVWLSLQGMPSISSFLSSFAVLLGLYFFVFFVAKQLVLGLASITLNSTVDVSRLEVGMIPAEQIVQVEQASGAVHYEKRQVDFSGGQDNRTIISPDPAGLTAAEIVRLRNLAAEGALAEFGNRVNIQPSIGFAPVIFVGTLLTVFCQGPFYLKLMQLF